MVGIVTYLLFNLCLRFQNKGSCHLLRDFFLCFFFFFAIIILGGQTQNSMLGLECSPKALGEL